MAAAQNARTQKTEVELGGNYSFAAVKDDAINAKYNFGGYFEMRFNLRNLPLDAGFRLEFTQYEMRYEGDIEDYNFGPLSLMGVANYSFRRGCKINPYAGLGIGIFGNFALGGCDDCFEMTKNDVDGVGFAFAPQVGVKFLDRINLSVGYTFTSEAKSWQHATLRLGYYF